MPGTDHIIYFYFITVNPNIAVPGYSSGAGITVAEFNAMMEEGVANLVDQGRHMFQYSDGGVPDAYDVPQYRVDPHPMPEVGERSHRLHSHFPIRLKVRKGVHILMRLDLLKRIFSEAFYGANSTRTVYVNVSRRFIDNYAMHLEYQWKDMGGVDITQDQFTLENRLEAFNRSQAYREDLGINEDISDVPPAPEEQNQPNRLIQAALALGGIFAAGTTLRLWRRSGESAEYRVPEPQPDSRSSATGPVFPPELRLPRRPPQ